jgi:hypothetical protein
MLVVKQNLGKLYKKNTDGYQENWINGDILKVWTEKNIPALDSL